MIKSDKILKISLKMTQESLPSAFIIDVCGLAQNSNPILGLMTLWSEESDVEEKNEIVADLQTHIDDKKYFDSQSELPVVRPKVDYDDLKEVVDSVSKFKAHLKKIIDKHGGVSAVATKLGMPQPSLSRLLNSGSMPRKSTLYKIAKVLDLPEKSIVTEWTQ